MGVDTDVVSGILGFKGKHLVTELNYTLFWTVVNSSIDEKIAGLLYLRQRLEVVNAKYAYHQLMQRVNSR
jgi:hypothetical protein